MTMPNDHEHAVCGEVEQADREAAAKIYDLLGFGPCQHIVDGMEDDIGVVAIVARHRIASVAALAAEVERARAETIEAADDYRSFAERNRVAKPGNDHQWYWAGQSEAAYAIAKTLRALAGEGA